MSRLDNCTRAVLLFALAVLAASSIQAGAQVAKERTYDDADGYDVLSVLLDRFGNTSAKSGMVVNPFTVSEKQMLSAIDDRCARIPEEFRSATVDFREKNKFSFRLANKFTMEVKYEITDDPGKYLPQEPGPGDQKVEGLPFLKPVFKVSAVGFDKTRTHAIAYVSAFCGGDCASGGFYLLEKGKQGWKEVKGSPTCEWMSREGNGANLRGGA